MTSAMSAVFADALLVTRAQRVPKRMLLRDSSPSPSSGDAETRTTVLESPPKAGCSRVVSLLS